MRNVARTDRAYRAPVQVVDGRISLAFDRLFKTDGDGRLTIDIAELAGALADELAGRGLVAVDREVQLLEAARVPALTQSITSPPTQAEVLAIQNKVNELLARLVAADHLQE